MAVFVCKDFELDGDIRDIEKKDLIKRFVLGKETRKKGARKIEWKTDAETDWLNLLNYLNNWLKDIQTVEE